MPRIRDQHLRHTYRELAGSVRQAPDTHVDDSVVGFIIAAVADRGHLSVDEALEQIGSGALSPAEIVKLGRDGMSTGERRDLEQILDHGEVPLSDRARNLLEAILGRAEIDPDADFSVDGLEIHDQNRRGFKGWAMPGSTIEAINLSKAPGGRLHLEDTVVIGKADGDGDFRARFLGQLKGTREGDLVRLRARDADGAVSNWLTVRIQGLGGTDQRNAVVNLNRLQLEPRGRRIAISNFSSRPISEPHARLQLHNRRSGRAQIIELDGNGSIPPRTHLHGRPGDVFEVAVSDGTCNRDFALSCGELICPGGDRAVDGVDLADPMLHKDDLDRAGRPNFSLRRFKGPAIVRGVRPADVNQGYLGNCFFPSAMAAIANARPDAIKQMIRSHDDGTYGITFKRWDEPSYAYVDVEVKVDGDLWVRASGEPLYGTSGSTNRNPEEMELWYPLIEKAYAKWKGGSYQRIGGGGVSADVFEQVLGLWPVCEEIKELGSDKVWQQIKTSCDAGMPVSAGTHGEKRDALYTNTGLYSDHSYTVLGYEEKDGLRLVKMRNPWGESEPPGNGHDDGVFTLPFADFCKYFESFHTCEAF